ncbi:MAG TPA: hypothetical protein VF529_03675 [Solirubrobacteraceae bacterium]|jgi:hypothetical protein
MTIVSPDVVGPVGEGAIFSLARRILVLLLDRAIQRRTRVIVREEVQNAVLECLAREHARPTTVQLNVVIGEVYNLAGAWPGVSTGEGVLQLDDALPRSVSVDDPELRQLVENARRRLAEHLAHEPPQPSPHPDSDEASAPISDDEQRLTREAAERYRMRLERIAAEDVTR